MFTLPTRTAAKWLPGFKSDAVPGWTGGLVLTVVSFPLWNGNGKILILPAAKKEKGRGAGKGGHCIIIFHFFLKLKI